MTPPEASREADALVRAGAIVRAAASDFTRSWIADRRAAGASLEAVHKEMAASSAEAQRIIARFTRTVATLLLEEASRRDQDAFDLAVGAAKARGAFVGWWGMPGWTN